MNGGEFITSDYKLDTNSFKTEFYIDLWIKILPESFYEEFKNASKH